MWTTVFVNELHFPSLESMWSGDELNLQKSRFLCSSGTPSLCSVILTIMPGRIRITARWGWNSLYGTPKPIGARRFSRTWTTGGPVSAFNPWLRRCQVTALFHPPQIESCSSFCPFLVTDDGKCQSIGVGFSLVLVFTCLLPILLLT